MTAPPKMADNLPTEFDVVVVGTGTGGTGTGGSAQAGRGGGGTRIPGGEAAAASGEGGPGVLRYLRCLRDPGGDIAPAPGALAARCRSCCPH